MKKIITTIIFCSFIYGSFSQSFTNSSYRELQSLCLEYRQKNNIDSALIVWTYAVEKFPEYLQYSSAILADLYVRQGNDSKAIEIWKSGMRKGYNYSLSNPFYTKHFIDNKDFKKLFTKETTKLKKAHIQHKVLLPTNYTSSNQYPVVFILHGNNRNLEKSMKSWSSGVMQDDYISVFVQSYIYSNKTDYIWKSGDAKTEKEFRHIYEDILNSYPVDTSKIVFSGMSAGGYLVLEWVFKDFVPISGVLLNCPVIPNEISDEQIKRFVEENKRLGIITGEDDFALSGQKSLINRIKEHGGKGHISINKDLGHAFAEDFSSQLDEYLDWITASDRDQIDQSFLEGPNAYFGLKPPGVIPEVFAPGIVSDSSWAEHCQLAVSPDGKEIYWSAWSSRYPPADTAYGKNSEQIYFSEFKNGRWTKPDLADFIKDHLTCMNGGPSFTPDGNRLYFYSTGIEGGLGLKDVWYVQKTDKGWTEIRNAGAPLNTDVGDWAPSFTHRGHAYHMGNTYYDKNEKPLQFTFSDGQFSNPKPVIIHPDYRPAYAVYVSPDESYLIFSGIHKDGHGGLDLYLAFKDDDDNWEEPINMGEKINSDKTERFPIVSPDGKYLFFMRHTPGQDIFWVSTDIISILKQQSINR